MKLSGLVRATASLLRPAAAAGSPAAGAARCAAAGGGLELQRIAGAAADAGSGDISGVQQRRGMGTGSTATGDHPLYELDKIKKTAAGIIDAVEDEPGTGDMPHISAPIPEAVDPDFRLPDAETTRQGASAESIPDHFAAETLSHGSQGLPSPSTPAELQRQQQQTGEHATMASRAHEGTNLCGSGYDSYGKDNDYSGGSTPVVTDPLTGLASGTVVGKPGFAGRADGVGEAVIEGRGQEAVGLNTMTTNPLRELAKETGADKKGGWEEVVRAQEQAGPGKQ